MNREEIIRMALAAGIFHEYDSEGHWDGLTNEALIGKDWLSSKEHKLDRIVEILSPFAALVAAAERNKLAEWMMRQGYATGHGDTTEDLLKEIDWQIEERIKNEREACAELVWPTQQFKVWSDEELTAMTGAFNRAQEKHGWYETIMAVGAVALKGRAAAIRARGESEYGRVE